MSARVYDIAPIPTMYRGQLFRSRTEAKWAAFFHEARIPYQYEAQAYHLPGGRGYLPDFALFGNKLLAEVKPTMPILDEITKGIALSAMINVPLIYLVGGPSEEFQPIVWPYQTEDSAIYDCVPWARLEKCRRCSGSVLALYWTPDVCEICSACYFGAHDDIDRCADIFPCEMDRPALRTALDPSTYGAGPTA